MCWLWSRCRRGVTDSHQGLHHNGQLPILQLASAYGKLGNIDANTGDAQTGWDTDQFLTDPKEALLVAATILKQGGLAPGDSSVPDLCGRHASVCS